MVRQFVGSETVDTKRQRQIGVKALATNAKRYCTVDNEA